MIILRPKKIEDGIVKPVKVVLERPSTRMSQHLKPLYINAHFDGLPIDRVLVDGSVINVMPQIMLRTLQRIEKELIPTEINVQGFTGVPMRTKGILLVELRVGTRTSMTAFFMVETIVAYNALLGRD